MQSKKQIFLELIENEQFISWLIAPNEKSDEFWKNWIQNNPEKAFVLKEIKSMVNSIELRDSYQMNPFEKDEVLHKILNYADYKREQKKPKEASLLKRINRTTWFFAAACFLVGSLLTAKFFKVFEQEIVIPQIVKEEWISKSTPKGSKSSFYLPDGTYVKLNSLSSLEFPTSFSDTIRVVKLVGQGFFEVTHNSEAPFIVQTENMDIKVLGTSFDVSSYPGSEVQEVAVVTGKVLVDELNGSKETILPSKKSILNTKTGQLTTSNFSPIYQTGWRDGILAFKEKSLKQVFENLENWYGVEIQIDQAINLRRKYTGTYENQSLENVLIGMSKILEIDFEIKEKEVQVTSQK